MTEQLRTTGRVRLNGTISGLKYSLDTSPDFGAGTGSQFSFGPCVPSIRAAADSLEFNVGIGSLRRSSTALGENGEIYGSNALLGTP